MPSSYGYSTTLPVHTAFLRDAERQDVADGIGLAKLAMWYANEDVPFETSVANLGQCAGRDITAVRVAYECLAYGRFSHTPRTQVIALFMVNELRCRVERLCRPKRGLQKQMAAAWNRLGRGRRIDDSVTPA